ncbi:MAG: glycoside hydrolase family 43 protein [Ginsengibacter sp.]
MSYSLSFAQNIMTGIIKQVNYIIFLLVISIGAACKKNTATSGGINPPSPPNSKDTTFTNPLLPGGPDPWVIQQDTNYYYTNTLGNRLDIFKTNKMSKLIDAVAVTIWRPPATGPYSKDIWAPEIHYLQNKWYIYFAADDGDNKNHRIYVLENSSADPLTSSWQLKGKVADGTDRWAIDASEFEYNGVEYLVWSGWPGDSDGQQNIYIAKMKDPWTIDGNRVMLATPSYGWEINGSPPAVNEGPEILQNPSGKIFLTYSASGCWTDDYALGMLSLKDGSDPLDASNWTKSASPVFTKNTNGGAFGPGHNGFFKSRDGKEDWIIYHANSNAGQGCGDARNPRIQKFTWNSDGTPDFGIPVAINTLIKVPAGE